MANQMKGVLSKLIGDGQTIFVLNRNVTDIIIIAQEVVNTIRKKNATKSMAIKIDLQKAYDWLIWEFIEDTLREASFPDNFVKLIMFCITLVSMQVLWNGVPTEKFLPSRGIRQGNPISP